MNSEYNIMSLNQSILRKLWFYTLRLGMNIGYIIKFPVNYPFILVLFKFSFESQHNLSDIWIAEWCLHQQNFRPELRRYKINGWNALDSHLFPSINARGKLKNLKPEFIVLLETWQFILSEQFNFMITSLISRSNPKNCVNPVRSLQLTSLEPKTLINSTTHYSGCIVSNT